MFPTVASGLVSNLKVVHRPIVGLQEHSGVFLLGSSSSSDNLLG